MKIRKSIVAAATAAVLGTTGALVLPAVASAHNASTTLKFTSVTVKRVAFTRTNVGLLEIDVTSTGKTLGFDVVNVTFTGTSTATGNVALTIKGGLLYGTLATTNGGKTITGKVTGGTGPYTGATGTIAGKVISSTKAVFTVVYSTGGGDSASLATSRQAPRPG
jgi:hypothetical protein